MILPKGPIRGPVDQKKRSGMRGSAGLLLLALLCGLACANPSASNAPCREHYGRSCASRNQYIRGAADPSDGSRPLLYVRIQGELAERGKAFVFLHGVQGDGAWFQGQLDEFCKAGNLAVSIDSRGTGFSDHVGPYDPFTRAADVYEVMKALRIERPAVMVGWSYGGPAMQAFYNAHPANVSALVLVDTTCSYVITDEFPFAINPNFRLALVAGCAADYVACTNTAIDARILSDRINVSAFPSLRNDAARLDEVRDKAKRIGVQSGRDTIVGEYSAFPLFDNHARLGEIAVPVLIVHGQNDTIFNLSVPRYVHSKIPNSRLVIFDGKGHASFALNVRLFNEVLRDFVSGAAGPQAAEVHVGSYAEWDIAASVPDPEDDGYTCVDRAQ